VEELDPPYAQQASFEVSTDAAGAAVVRISGELDISGVDALDAEVQPLLANKPRRVIVDAGGLRFADSSAIALWVRWATASEEFELRNPTPLLRRVIAGMGLTQKLAVSP
jgi:anti-anti-sigma factor